jgi:hypothetical protein
MKYFPPPTFRNLTRQHPGRLAKPFSGKPFITLSIMLLFSVITSKPATAASFSITSSTTLTAAALSELGLSSSGTAYSEGSYNTDVTWQGDVDGQASSLDQVITGSTVVRNNILLWYYSYNNNTEYRPTFNASYRIFGTGGVENTLSSLTASSSTIGATLTAQPVTCSKYSGSTYRCYGYANLNLNLAAAKRSGTYRGTVQITIVYY